MAITPPAASTFVTYGIGDLAVLVAGGWIWALDAAGRRSGEPLPATVARNRRFVPLLLAWMGATHLLASSGALARFDLRPPPFLGLMLAVTVIGPVFARSAWGRLVGDRLPLAALIAIHAFRLPLELVMHEAAREGTMPIQMSFSGLNFDIVTGATAIPLAWLAAKGRAPRGLLLAWNVMGLILLGTIVGIALASTPLVRAFGDDPARANTWIAFPPFEWLPAILVLTAWTGHLVLLRRLARGLDPLPAAPTPATVPPSA